MSALQTNVIHTGDALAVLKTLPDNSVNCVVTSPPYNILNTTGGGFTSKKSRWKHRMIGGYGGLCSDDMPHDEYIAWQRSILVECLRAIKPDGAIFYNHKWRVQDGKWQRLADDITAGLPVRQVIIWDRGSGFNFNDGYFVPSYEVIYMLTGDDFRLQKGHNVSGDVWRFPADISDKVHPNAFPITLPMRCIRASTRPGDIVIDPFAGSGTTLAAAKRLDRRYIGVELNPQYVALASKRLDEPYTLPMLGLFEESAS